MKILSTVMVPNKDNSELPITFSDEDLAVAMIRITVGDNSERAFSVKLTDLATAINAFGPAAQAAMQMKARENQSAMFED